MRIFTSCDAYRLRTVHISPNKTQTGQKQKHLQTERGIHPNKTKPKGRLAPASCASASCRASSLSSSGARSGWQHLALATCHAPGRAGRWLLGAALAALVMGGFGFGLWWCSLWNLDFGTALYKSCRNPRSGCRTELHPCQQIERPLFNSCGMCYPLPRLSMIVNAVPTY